MTEDEFKPNEVRISCSLETVDIDDGRLIRTMRESDKASYTRSPYLSKQTIF